MVSPKFFLAVCGLMLLPALVTSSPIASSHFGRKLFSRNNITATTVAAELGPQLSNGSLVFGSDNPQWSNATIRWNRFVRPNVQVVVEPAAESDIAEIIKYCNDNSFEFLVRNRGHGITSSLSTFSGIQINVEGLQGITIQPDEGTAVLQAGTSGGQVIRELWDQGYVTTTGATQCVGIMGPALGGGHGRYNGLHGLVTDNILHYNVVLANGTKINVNETSHSDLLWALKGAGHNFAAVTSIVKKIYPREIDTWHFHNYTWTQDKLETVFETLNTFHKSYNGTTPPKMGVNFGSIIMDRSISTAEAVLKWGFYYAGPAVEAEELLRPFNAIGAVAEGMIDLSYPDIAGLTSGDCAGGNLAISSVLTLEYNATAERTLYDHYISNVAKYPELAATAYLWYEGYATAGYQAIPSESTAYPHREENHIMFFATVVPDGSDLLEVANTWAKESTDIWNGGQPDRQPKLYVNYAMGHDYETLESIYGYEAWRLERLRSLKAAYDPENRFRFFVPLVSNSTS
ncbi:hypothetical protein HBI82_225000 [Parastagonospora nodorum]|nr:hypothetical protein HBI72_084750 [Parastagonospora nodorum]KAH5638051.1 hypothetical protein HBI23_207120 [Parastagonospora nodorum]KAH5983870.1 hypothetical protein HBI82_225000 [Parastagonospora nodorum]